MAALPSVDFGRRVLGELQQKVTFDQLFPEQVHEATPEALRGATMKAVQKQRGRQRSWHPVRTVMRLRSRTLIVAHLFSGHRRDGDLTGLLSNLPSPDGAIVVAIPIDIIHDGVRCDLARKETQSRWKAIARVGSLLGFVAGPPCETFSIARIKGG